MIETKFNEYLPQLKTLGFDKVYEELKEKEEKYAKDKNSYSSDAIIILTQEI